MPIPKKKSEQTKMEFANKLEKMSAEVDPVMEAPEEIHKVDGKTLNKLESMKKKDSRMVRGVFNFYEVPGGTLEFVFRKYKGDPIKKYKLEDQKVYEIPFGVANHLNKNGWYPIHEHKLGRDGRPSVMIGKKIRRFGFHSLDYKEELQEVGSSNVVTVQRII